MREPELFVLHVACLGDRQALETLGRTTQVIAAEGLGQLLLVLDGGRGAHATWPAAAAEVRALRCSGLSIFGKVRALQAEFARLLAEKTLYAVHFHGVGPCLLGSRALRGSALRGRVLYSPHWSPHGPAWAAALLGRLLQIPLSPFHHAALAGSLNEAGALSRLLEQSAEVLPHPVSDVFFAVSRQEDAPPNVVADGRGAEAVDIASRLCVLLNGRDARVPFAFLGAVEGKARAHLEAANVAVRDAAHEGDRVQLLSRASVFIHASLRDRFPLAVAQAMAAGVPCLASDTPAHRALIHHGETGFVCASRRDFLGKLVFLLRDRAERRRLGQAARAEAQRRFAWRQFQRAVLRAYGFTGGEEPPPNGHLRDRERQACKQL